MVRLRTRDTRNNSTTTGDTSTMFYFRAPKGEELSAIQASAALTRKGIELEMSALAIDTLHGIKQAKQKVDDDYSRENYNQLVVHSLFRKGLIHRPGAGKTIRVTRLGDIVLELCDACGLVNELKEKADADVA
jgi:hypothetical protein